MPPRLIDVALPLPLFKSFTYAVDREFANPLVPGARVVVPLRNKREIGICLGPSAPGTQATAKTKAILDVPDATPALTPALVEVCRWMAEYYVVPIGQAMRCALPVLLTGASAPTPAQRTRRVAQIARHVDSLLHRDRIFGRAPQQRALYELMEGMGGRAPVEHLLEHLSFSPSVLKGLVARGLVVVTEEVVARDPFADRAGLTHVAHRLSDAQQAALAALTTGAPGETFLLHGITGSGKTLVYIELLRQVVARGKTAIVLVPEIALTPQTVDRFRAVFGDRIAVLHSALSDGERYDEWLALRRGEKQIAVGARSAVFAPLENLGAIVVDEEHESSYKQGESPRYHARETAIVRARQEGAVVVLGSATPSLESWVNAERGKYRLLTLPDRVGGANLPAVEAVDLRRTRPTRSPGAGIPEEAMRADAAFRWVVSEALETALSDRLEKGEQSILLLNRRGYSSFVQCNDCGDVATCEACSISLTYHRAPERLVCHYCLHQETPRERCRRCGGATLRQKGLGTQQVERLLAERFVDARIARMDVDTTSGKWAHADILDRVGRGEVDILLGTQMIAKGLDFPNVTLVGVIDADVGINLPDFRASERCYQLLSQVAGRAGRGPKGGRVLIQTRAPEHHAVRYALSHDYERFVHEELSGRTHPAYPPNLRLANVVFSGTAEHATAALAERGSAWLRKLIAARAPDAITVIGPAPCPVEKIKNRWRWHVLLKSDQPAELSRVGRYFLERFSIAKTADLRVTFDRDPVALL